MVKASEYPDVECDSHPGVREPGYMVCNHINDPKDVAYLELAIPTKLGVVACKECSSLAEETTFWLLLTDLRSIPSKIMLQHFYLACAQGLRERGILSTTQVN